MTSKYKTTCKDRSNNTLPPFSTAQHKVFVKLRKIISAKGENNYETKRQDRVIFKRIHRLLLQSSLVKVWNLKQVL